MTSCKLVAIHLDRPISYLFFQVPANFFFIVMTTGQELGHWEVSRFSNVTKLWNAIMKQKLRLFAIHQIITSLQRTGDLYPRTRWYLTLDESNQMISAYFAIHPDKNPQNGCWLKSVIFFKSTGFTSSTFPIQPDSSQNQLAAITLNTGSPQTLHQRVQISRPIWLPISHESRRLG
jgi:hypothetical protein